LLTQTRGLETEEGKRRTLIKGVLAVLQQGFYFAWVIIFVIQAFILGVLLRRT
jgi:hypothetical protein